MRYGRITAARRRALELLATGHVVYVEAHATSTAIPYYVASWLLEQGLAVDPIGGLSPSWLQATVEGKAFAESIGIEVSATPVICQEWNCEQPPIIGERFCRRHIAATGFRR